MGHSKHPGYFHSMYCQEKQCLYWYNCYGTALSSYQSDDKQNDWQLPGKQHWYQILYSLLQNWKNKRFQECHCPDRYSLFHLTHRLRFRHNTYCHLHADSMAYQFRYYYNTLSCRQPTVLHSESCHRNADRKLNSEDNLVVFVHILTLKLLYHHNPLIYYGQKLKYHLCDSLHLQSCCDS